LAVLAPPFGHHQQNTQGQAQHKHRQQHQHLGRQPLLAKKEMHRHIVLVVQREGKQGEKNGCFQRPLKQPDEFLQVGSSGA